MSNRIQNLEKSAELFKSISGYAKADENAQKAVMNCLELVGLADSCDKYPNELSGGMKSRVSLARALLYGGDLLLLDEPFSALDEEMRQELATRLRRELKKEGKTAILVTHLRAEAEAFADRILRLPAKTE